MNIQHALIHNACLIEVADASNKFTDAQKERLNVLLKKFSNAKTWNIPNFSKTLGAFEKEFIDFGGDHDKLMENITKIRDETYISAAKMTGLKIVKE